MIWYGYVKNYERIRGTETYPLKKKRKIDGFTYIGQFKNGKYNGKGLVLMDDGFKYYGEWKNSMKNGVGIQYQPEDNYLYKGVFKDNKFVKVIKELKSYKWRLNEPLNIIKFRNEFKDFYKKKIKSKLLYSFKKNFKNGKKKN